ncbi:MAG: hypothetical protein ACYC9L_15145 [Sulfuricaulis sp.]
MYDHSPLARQKTLVIGANTGIGNGVVIAPGQAGADRTDTDQCIYLEYAGGTQESVIDKHPDDLAKGSGQFRRNYMRHNQHILVALLHQPDDIADAIFYPSIGKVNPTLTIIANTFRATGRIKERLK